MRYPFLDFIRPVSLDGRASELSTIDAMSAHDTCGATAGASGPSRFASRGHTI